MVLVKLLRANSQTKVFHQSNSLLENPLPPPQKTVAQEIPHGIFPPILLIAFLHLTLRIDKFSQT